MVKKKKTTPRLRMRPCRIERGVNAYAEGSALIEMGRTRLICTASIEDRVPDFRRGTGLGWVTAEYGMLPRSTPTRILRERGRPSPDGRMIEISRLIGRSLRMTIDMAKLGERTILIDCDVIQADGGTRCAAITGGMVALAEATNWLLRQNVLTENPLQQFVAAISVGIVDGKPVLDLDYDQDSRADVDLNVVITEDGRFVEIQGTAEHTPFDTEQLALLQELARRGIRRLFALQKAALR